MKRLHRSILGTIGDTPAVRLNHMAPEGAEVYVKLEAFNPMGSVKDRLALGIIEAAERKGSLKPGQTVIEATSGNTGVGLAMVCAAKGYPLVLTMAESFSVERRKMMRFLGAKVILTPASEKGTGMIAKARELAEKHGWFFCRQFENEAGPDFHSRTTAKEILRDFEGAPLHSWVSGYGTGGTLKGVARVLKESSPGTRVIAAEPDNSPLLGSGLNQNYATDGSALSHPAFRPHPMQGWTPDFIPKLVTDSVSAGLVDEVVQVPGAAAMVCAKTLAQKEGIFCGITGGATLAAALEVAKRAPRGSRILAMLPDTGERYLSTPLFGEVTEEMTVEEQVIAASTPGYRFDAMATPATYPKVDPQEVDHDTIALVESLISDSRHPVVLFALEWCEFSWSIRKLFAEVGVEFRSIDLDGPGYRKNELGGAMRRELARRTGAATIPQVFIGGRHVGGATDTIEAFNSGALHRLLASVGRNIDASKVRDSGGLLPAWFHPRQPRVTPSISEAGT